MTGVIHLCIPRLNARSWRGMKTNLPMFWRAIACARFAGCRRCKVHRKLPRGRPESWASFGLPRAGRGSQQWRLVAIAIAVSLPWSTSATAILVGLWFFAPVPVLRWDKLRREILTPAGGLPVLLVLLGVAGMLWADVTLIERWKGTRFVSQATGDTVAAGAIPSIRARELGLRGLSLVVRCTPGRYGDCHRWCCRWRQRSCISTMLL